MKMMRLSFVLLIISTLITKIDMDVECKYSDRCKWSNENCEHDYDCCSGVCSKSHEGMNPRCALTPIHCPCFLSYQCDDGLECGHMYNCCSPYWGVCADVGDCCEPEHVCRPEPGFTYKRCLPPSGSTRASSDQILLSVSISFALLSLLSQRML